MDDGFPTTTLRLSGSETIAQVDGLCDRLRASLQASHSVIVDCDALEEADLALVQALIAARLSAQRRRTAFHLKHPLCEPLSDALRRGGFFNDPQHAAFWTGGDEQHAQDHSQR
ncbi:STAS domain-containing protein [Azospirillum griseum]|nr:STAS domain-containing protein [Azospirillum griseum]